jgi:hypothetical protein
LYDTKDLVVEDMHDDIPKRLNHSTSNVPSEAPNSEEMKIYENITYNGLHAEVVKESNDKLFLIFPHLRSGHGRRPQSN